MQSRWIKFLTRYDPDAEASPYAAYSERMLSAAIDLLFVMMMLRRPLAWIDALISPHLQQAIAQSGLHDGLTAVQNQSAFAQIAMLFDKVFNSDVWKYVLLNHGAAVLLILLLLVAIQYAFATTPGKWLLGLKLTKKDGETPPSLLQVLWRYGVCIFSCGFLMIGLVWVMFNKKRLSWHDIAARTCVINTRQRGWYWQQLKRGFFWLKSRLS
jgi:uncharacterized RDD family membrane protein YckC